MTTHGRRLRYEIVEVVGAVESLAAALEMVGQKPTADWIIDTKLGRATEIERVGHDGRTIRIRPLPL